MNFVIRNFNLLIDITEELEKIEKQLNKLAENMDNPFIGMAVFIVLMVAAFIAIRSFSK